MNPMYQHFFKINCNLTQNVVNHWRHGQWQKFTSSVLHWKYEAHVAKK